MSDTSMMTEAQPKSGRGSWLNVVVRWLPAVIPFSIGVLAGFLVASEESRGGLGGALGATFVLFGFLGIVVVVGVAGLVALAFKKRGIGRSALLSAGLLLIGFVPGTVALDALGLRPYQPVAGEYPESTEPPGPVGNATLSGSIPGTFVINGGTCPTSQSPEGDLSGRGTAEGQAAIVQINFNEQASGSDEVNLVLYIEGIDKEGAPVWRGPGEVLADAGGGFSVVVEVAPLSAEAKALGPAFLEASWTCPG